MKQLYIILILILVPRTLVAQNKSANYVMTKTIIGACDTLATIEYFDGLGRSSETVQKGYSGNGTKDLVTLTEYDGMGNEYKSWLPTPFSSTGSNVEADDFHAMAKSTYSDQMPYYKYEYAKALNDEIAKEWGPGNSWALLRKTKNVQYDGVSDLTFPRLTLSSDKKSFCFGRFYKKGSVRVIKQSDEDNFTVAKYYDLTGRLVMEVVGGNSTTYYLYDNDGNLIFVLPPAAYEACLPKINTPCSIDTDENLRKYAYFYRYDGKNRCVEKKLPGCEPVKMLYDKENKMIFKQDGNLRKNNEWQFMLFDAYNRPTVMGVCKDADKSDISSLNVVSRFSASGKYAMYDANVDLDVCYLMKANYYDNYSFLGKNSTYVYQHEVGYDSDISHSGNKTTTKGMLTGTRTYELNEENGYYIESLYYNDKGEVVQSHKGNQVEGTDDFYYLRSPYTGKLYKEKQVHRVGMKMQTKYGNAIENIVRRYAYDTVGRLDSLKFKWNNNKEFLVKSYQYNDFGQVSSTRGRSYPTFTNYFYNVRGQLVLADGTLTKQTLWYNTKYDYKRTIPSYNGNISVDEWKYRSGEKWVTEAYEYAYDKCNRLSSALSTSVDTLQNIVIGSHDTEYEYDKMGNITSIVRKSVNIDDGTVDYRDDATLEYDGNHLVHVSNKGFTDSSRDTQIAAREYGNADEFSYDANGNMTRNLNKGIVKIVYNVLNLPDYIYMRNGEYIHNTYDGDGNKLSSDNGECKYNVTIPETGNVQGNLDSLAIKRLVNLSDDQKVVYYCGDFVYHTTTVMIDSDNRNSLKGNNDGFWVGGNNMEKVLVTEKIDFGEGFIRPGFIPIVFDYIKDNLGNIRFVAMNGKIMQANNYYPFGGFYGDDSNEYLYRWRFGNKELDRKVDIYSWGFRNYDPTTGGFLTVDPMCELNYSMTPYSFANNNPANYTDLFGLRTYSWDDFVKHWHDFDVNNDNVELPQVVCTASKPFTFENAYDEFGRRLGEIDEFSRLLNKLNSNYGGSKLSQPLWNSASYIKNNFSYLGRKLNLSTFHPCYVYRGITNNVNKLAKYGRNAGNISVAMDVVKTGLTGDAQASDVLDVAIPAVAKFIPGVGWVLTGGYLLLDTGVEIWTGKSIGEHLNDCVREEYGYDTFNFYNGTFK